MFIGAWSCFGTDSSYSLALSGAFLICGGTVWSLLTTSLDFPESVKVTTKTETPKGNRAIWLSLILIGVCLLSLQSWIAGAVALLTVVAIRWFCLPAILCHNLIKMKYFRLIELFNLSLAGDEDKYFDRAHEVLMYSPDSDYTIGARFTLKGCVNALYDPSWFGWLLRRRVIWDEGPSPLSLESISKRCQIEGFPNEAAQTLKRALVFAKKADEKTRRCVEEAESIHHVTETKIHVQVLNHLVSLYIEQGKYDEAEKLLDQATLRSPALSDDYASAKRLAHLGCIRRMQNKHPESEGYLKTALSIGENLAKEPPSPYFDKQYFLRFVLNELADLYLTECKYADSIAAIQAAIDVAKGVSQVEGSTGNSLHSYHKYKNAQAVISYLNKLAGIYEEQKNVPQAEAILQESITIAKKGHPYGHLTLTTSLNTLARLYSEHGDFQKAELEFKRALEYSEVGLRDGADLLVYMLGRLHNLANLYMAQGKLTEAEPLLKKSIDISEAVAGLKHPITSVSLKRLSALYEAQNNSVLATLLKQHADSIIPKGLAIAEKALGRNHPNIAMLYKLEREDYRHIKMAPQKVPVS
jgi:tetratricopeptide (TPR) repeat protein